MNEALQHFIESLKNPIYVHVLLNPVPIYGVGLGALGLVVALLFRSRPAERLALFIIAVSGLAAWPAMESGEAAADRLEPTADQATLQAIEVHEHRAERGVWAFFVTAGVAAVGIAVPAKLERIGRFVSCIALLCSLGALLAGARIARAGGRIRHEDFRSGTPAVPVAAETEAEKGPI